MTRSPGRRARRASGRTGFTFVEALIALAVLGFAALAFSSILGGAGTSGESSKTRIVSLSLAQSILEEALRLPYASLAVGVVEDASLTGYPGTSSRVEIAQATASTKSIAVTISTADGDVRLVGYAGDYERAAGAGGGDEDLEDDSGGDGGGDKDKDDNPDDNDNGDGNDPDEDKGKPGDKDKDKDKDKDDYLGDNDNGDGNDPDEDKGKPGDKGDKDDDKGDKDDDDEGGNGGKDKGKGKGAP